jgi:DNA-binding PadR family transcriptional regulator
MKDFLDEIILSVAYENIEQSSDKRVAGSTVWEKTRIAVPDLAPVTVPGRLKRLVSHGLLEKDKAGSTRRTKFYAPTDAGLKKWQELKSAR